MTHESSPRTRGVSAVFSWSGILLAASLPAILETAVRVLLNHPPGGPLEWLRITGFAILCYLPLALISVLAVGILRRIHFTCRLLRMRESGPVWILLLVVLFSVILEAVEQAGPVRWFFVFCALAILMFPWWGKGLLVRSRETDPGMLRGIRILTLFLIPLAVLPLLPKSVPSEMGNFPPRSILWITVDTLRADRLPAYGCNTICTPTLDRLTRTGSYFRRAVAPSSWTKSSMASLFTGLYPSRHGVRDVTSILPNGLPTVAEVLQNSRYQTCAFGVNPWMKRKFGFHRGFREYFDLDALTVRESLIPYRAFLRIVAAIQGRTHFAWSSTRAEDIVDNALRWLSSHQGEHPLFLYLHFMDVHAPYDPPRPFDRLLLSEPSGGNRAADAAWRFALGEDLSKEARAHALSRYDGAVSSLDRELGRLMNGLGESFLSESLLVITSDHGEEFLDHGFSTHGTSLFEEVTLVPLIVSGRDVTGRPEPIPSAVSLLSIPSTLVQFADAETPIEWKQESLLSYSEWESLPETPEPIYSELFFERREIRAVEKGEVKLVRDLEPRREQPSDGLFYLPSDPAERMSLADSVPMRTEIAEVRDRLQALLDQVGATIDPEEHTEMDAATRSQLEALGYLSR